jgi:osmotically-inducible protein OsmY
MILKKNAGAVVLAAAVGFGTLTVGAYAQDALSPSDSRQTARDHNDDMAARVKRALHSEPALNDKHIDVSMEKGKVVMRGFVTSAGDLQKAVRAASKTAGEKNVVNELTIQRNDEVNVSSG